MSVKRNSVTVIVFLLCAAGIAVLIFLPSAEKKPLEQRRTRLIVPSAADEPQPEYAFIEHYEENRNLKAPLDSDELALSVLNIDFDNDSIEEQIVAFRHQGDTENQVAITLFDFDDRNGQYRRLWNAPVAAMTPGTVSLYTQDLIGDRNDCIIVTGMDTQGDHIMMVFRRESPSNKNKPFTVVGEIRIGGSITVQETERPLAYQHGIAPGQPFVITAQGRDSASDNMLDRVEIAYAYNSARGIYEQNKITRVPGSQLEERRLREILTGEPKDFENFIHDLWYHVTPQGTIDQSQYLYFDPEKREIIFFGDGTQQIFTWNYSTSSRYGLFISSQNISVTTLRRFLNIELESLDSISMRVNEDIRLNILLNTLWNGSYRRAGIAARAPAEEKPVRPYIDAVYDSSMGRLRFYPNGAYELSASGTLSKGRYAFFRADDNDLLELRPEQSGAQSDVNGEENRLVYLCTGMEAGGNVFESGNLSLSRVRLGVSGIQELRELPVILTKSRD